MGTHVVAHRRARHKNTSLRATHTMRALKLAFLALAVLAVESEAARRRRKKVSAFTGVNAKAKISMAACARRCNKKGGCKKKAPTCKDKGVDVLFVLDGSSSVGPKNFTVVKDFMSNIVRKFSVSDSGVHVALHQY